MLGNKLESILAKNTLGFIVLGKCLDTRIGQWSWSFRNDDVENGTQLYIHRLPSCSAKLFSYKRKAEF